MNTPEVKEEIPVNTASSRALMIVRYSLMIIIAFYVVASAYVISDTRTRLASVAADQKAAIADLERRQAATENDLKASNQALTQQLGITERGLLAAYAGTKAELRKNERVFETRLQDQQSEAIDQVTSQVAAVQGDLSGAKTEIAATRTDLESTKVKLDRAIGDLTGQSSLIARTREDLEELRHRGDRNYFEFTLVKGARPQLLSTVSLQLKKADPRKNKFTLNVIADDRVIEKKDRGVAEPLQFYTGRDRLLYEVVIFTVDKNNVTGYLSTPKSPSLTATK